MKRLVIVAEPRPRPEGPRRDGGGLAVALQDAVSRRDAMWFGWSGKTAEATATEPALVRQGRLTYATLDLGDSDYRRYYQGFSNGSLWPTLHYRLGLAHFDRGDYAGYREVNAAFAAALAPLLRPERRGLGARLPPLPARRGAAPARLPPAPRLLPARALPAARRLLRPAARREMLADLAAYDVIGLQTEDDAANLRAALAAEGPGEAAGRVSAFPIGIDADAFTKLAERAVEKQEMARFRRSLAGRALVIGVDRLDYSKGLPQRFVGYDQLLARYAGHRSRVTYLQVTPISRGDVAQYQALRRELDELVGRINGDYAEPDWVPLRYMTRAVPRPTLAGFMRHAKAGLVTPLRDGHEPRRQGVRRRRRTRKTRARWCCPASPARRLPGGRAAGEPARPGRDRRSAGPGHGHAAGRALARWRRWPRRCGRDSARSWCRNFLEALEG
jgi:trehalose 6-phosphate synthase